MEVGLTCEGKRGNVGRQGVDLGWNFVYGHKREKRKKKKATLFLSFSLFLHPHWLDIKFSLKLSRVVGILSKDITEREREGGREGDRQTDRQTDREKAILLFVLFLVIVPTLADIILSLRPSVEVNLVYGCKRERKKDNKKQGQREKIHISFCRSSSCYRTYIDWHKTFFKRISCRSCPFFLSFFLSFSSFLLSPSVFRPIL